MKMGLIRQLPSMIGRPLNVIVIEHVCECGRKDIIVVETTQVSYNISLMDMRTKKPITEQGSQIITKITQRVEGRKLA